MRRTKFRKRRKNSKVLNSFFSDYIDRAPAVCCIIQSKLCIGGNNFCLRRLKGLQKEEEKKQEEKSKKEETGETRKANNISPLPNICYLLP